MGRRGRGHRLGTLGLSQPYTTACHKEGADSTIGFLEGGTHNLVGIESCPINSPVLNRSLEALIEMSKKKRFPRFLREIEFFTNETDVQINVIQTERPLAKVFF